MKLVQYSPAADWSRAFVLGNHGLTARIYGETQAECIDLSEAHFIRCREGKKGSRKAVVGKLQLKLAEHGTADRYQRSLDLDQGIAAVAWQNEAGSRSARAYVPKDYKILVYELSGEGGQMDLQIDYQPVNEIDYVNRNIGGIFFTADIDGWVLCGKAAVSTDGFPKVTDEGIRIKNASRVTLLIMLDLAEVPVEEERQQRMLELQMKMNRELVRLESISKEQLLKLPKSRLPVYRKMKQGLKTGLTGKWAGGKVE